LPALAHPAVLAAVLTLANLPKPAVVDDTAYLVFARHIAADPTNPYGFEQFWYSEPEPAMNVLAPPVVPYWLAAGIRLVGDDLVLLKLWLFPFALVFAYAARWLLARFARGTERWLLPAIVIGPGVLPFFNVMLDVPALALEAAAVALFVKSTAVRVSPAMVALAGVCAGLACQTKYSALGVTSAILWYGVVRRRLPPAVACLAVGVGVFAGWEAYIAANHGTSHFLYHLTSEIHSPDQRETVGKDATDRLGIRIGRQLGMFVPLLGQLGGTAWWVGSLGWLALGYGPRTVRGGAVAAAVLAVAILVLPGQWVVVVPGTHPAADKTTLNSILFVTLGTFAFSAGVTAAAVQVTRWRRARFFRREPDAWFLAGWLAIEIAASLAMTPFPAARRALGVSLVLALVAARLQSRLRRPGAGWIVPAAVASAVVLAAIDVFDALPERELPHRAAAFARNAGWTGTGYFIGHWGFQYYAEQSGMRPLAPARTELRPGDWIVLPVYPDEIGFYRPAGWEVSVPWDGPELVREVELVWDDRLAAQTIPNLYGGRYPVVSRKYPRLRIAVYRVVRPFRV
jgi:hypothetical protein